MYSTTSDIKAVLPNVEGSLLPTATFAADYAVQAAWAANEIDSYLEGNTAVPVVDATGVWLQEAEACLVAHRLLSARYSAVEVEGSEPFRSSFRKRAYQLLDDHEFQATADVPAKGPIFIGDGTISIEVNDHVTVNALWFLKAETATSFSITRKTKTGTFYYTYDLAEGQFPTDNDFKAGTEISKQIKIVITAGSTPFAQGDSWIFKTYGNFKKSRSKGISNITIERS